MSSFILKKYETSLEYELEYVFILKKYETSLEYELEYL